jgi:hypothetical protein
MEQHFQQHLSPKLGGEGAAEMLMPEQRPKKRLCGQSPFSWALRGHHPSRGMGCGMTNTPQHKVTESDGATCGTPAQVRVLAEKMQTEGQ